MTRAFFPIRRAAQWPKGGGTGIALALISAMATPPALAQVQGLTRPYAGTLVPALPVQIDRLSQGAPATVVTDSFSSFRVDRYLDYEVYTATRLRSGLVPGAEITHEGWVVVHDTNDRVSFRFDLTDETLPFENRTYTYDDHADRFYPDLISGGPVAISPSAIGSDISGDPGGRVTVDIVRTYQLTFFLTGTVPATANIGDTGSFNFWVEPLVPSIDPFGAANADAHSLLQAGPTPNTLMGIEAQVELLVPETLSGTVPESGAAASAMTYEVSVPDIELISTFVAVSEITDAASCAVEPALYPAFRAPPEFPALPGRCLSKYMSFQNRGLVATDNFPLIIQVPPELTFVALTVDTGLVDGPAAGVGPVIIDTDESGGPCSATSLNCQVTIEDASLPPQAQVTVQLKGLIR